MLESLDIKKDNLQLPLFNLNQKNGKLPKSHRYDQLPLLRSHPGGFSGAGCLGLAGAKIALFCKLKNNMTEKIIEKRLCQS